MFASVKYVTAPNIETGWRIATGLEKAKEISAKWRLKLLPVAGLAADFDFVHTVCYYNVYFHGIEAINGPHKRKKGKNGRLGDLRGQTGSRNMAAT